MGNQSLVLQSLKRNATGNYYCVASNAEGTTFSNPVSLDIKCKPKGSQAMGQNILKSPGKKKNREIK